MGTFDDHIFCERSLMQGFFYGLAKKAFAQTGKTGLTNGGHGTRIFNLHQRTDNRNSAVRLAERIGVARQVNQIILRQTFTQISGHAGGSPRGQAEGLQPVFQGLGGNSGAAYQPRAEDTGTNQKNAFFIFDLTCDVTLRRCG